MMDYLFMLIPMTIIAIFALMIVSSHQKLDIEREKEPLYTSTAGGRVGWLNYRGPFINLRIYNEFLVIGCGRKMVLRYAEIKRVEVRNWMGIVPDRIQIIHRNPRVPEHIIIGTTSPNRVKEIIDSRLYR